MPAADRLNELSMPSLIVIGANDLRFLLLAADYMVESMPNATRALIADAAHLPNMEHPARFRAAVEAFLSVA